MQNVGLIYMRHYCIVTSCYYVLLTITGVPYITDCVLGELEKMGQKYKLALKSVVVVLAFVTITFYVGVFNYTGSSRMHVFSVCPVITKERMLMIVLYNVLLR